LACGLAPIFAHGQSSFDSPPLPAETAAPSAVRGLANLNQVTTPSGTAGLGGAPPATFIAPGSITADQLAVGAGVETTRLAEISAEARPIEGSEIVARVEDQVILASDVLWQVNQMIALQEQSTGQKVPPDQLPKIQEMLLRRMVMQLIDTKLLFADFRRTLPPENLEAVNKSIAEPFENVEVPKLIKMFSVKDRLELEAALKPNGASLKEVQKQFTEKTVAGEWLRQKMPKPKTVTHEDLLAYYQDHLKEYEYPAQVRWEEPMVRLDRFNNDRESAWRTLASMGNEVWAAVVANPTLRGPVFGDIARRRSHGFTAADGGVHNWTTLGSLKCEELNQALATLELGQLSPGIESEYGFHIVRVLERKEAGRTPFTEAQAKIREILEAEQKEVLLTAELRELRKQARVWTKWDGDLTGERLCEVLDGRQKR
jgi:hypothetical protein